MKFRETLTLLLVIKFFGQFWRAWRNGFFFKNVDFVPMLWESWKSTYDLLHYVFPFFAHCSRDCQQCHVPWGFFYEFPFLAKGLRSLDNKNFKWPFCINLVLNTNIRFIWMVALSIILWHHSYWNNVRFKRSFT